MAAITVRSLPDETHRALKARAAAHGRSTEAEVRAILTEAVAEPSQEGLGTAISRIARSVSGFDDIQIAPRSETREPIDFS